MEFLIGYVLIAVILLFMGFSLFQIGVFTLMIVGALIVLIGGFFAVCLALLAFSKRRRGVFVEIDESTRFPVAVYNIDGENVPNMFPCEMVMKKRLYVPEKEITLLYCKPRKRTIDKNALVTIIVGSSVFIPAAVFSAIMIVSFIKGFSVA